MRQRYSLLETTRFTDERALTLLSPKKKRRIAWPTVPSEALAKEGTNKAFAPCLTADRTSRGRISAMPNIWRTLSKVTLVCDCIAAIPAAMLLMYTIFQTVIALENGLNIRELLAPGFGGLISFPPVQVEIFLAPMLPLSMYFAYRGFASGRYLFSLGAILLLIAYIYLAINPDYVICNFFNILYC